LGAGIVDLPARDGIGALIKYRAWSQQIYAVVTGEGYSYTEAPLPGVHILRIVRESQAFRRWYMLFVCKRWGITTFPWLRAM
jgi:hypothetical protein